MAHLYRGALHCEVFREEVFAGRRKPLVFGEPPPWMALLLEALRLSGEGDHRQAGIIREQAFDQAPEGAGEINEQPFSWIADGDGRLGPVLEIILDGRYFWAPVTQIRALSTKKPEELRDLIWLPAQFTWVNGGQAYGLLPVRYPGSETSADASILLARKTQWIEVAAGVFQGQGQRMMTTDQDEYPLLEIRSINLD
jgi:type VI secretion system protein ImpE